MNPPLRQEWINALAPVLGPEETEACFRIYADWLKDKNQELQQTSMEDVIRRLRRHEPIQYVLGEAWFYGMAFIVNKHTLIPRPETEELCDMIIKSNAGENLRILDVGTGSGCIPVTLLKHKIDWTATALDIDREALAIAEKNAQIQGVSERISFKQTDFIKGFSSADKWDLIVSNPPYINMAEKATMESNVLDWEPHTALFPKGNDALIFYKKLADLLYRQNSNCVLWAEINSALAEETLHIFNGFRFKKLIKDMSGKLRFLQVIT